MANHFSNVWNFWNSNSVIVDAIIITAILLKEISLPPWLLPAIFNIQVAMYITMHIVTLYFWCIYNYRWYHMLVNITLSLMRRLENMYAFSYIVYMYVVKVFFYCRFTILVVPSACTFLTTFVYTQEQQLWLLIHLDTFHFAYHWLFLVLFFITSKLPTIANASSYKCYGGIYSAIGNDSTEQRVMVYGHWYYYCTIMLFTPQWIY